MFKKGKILKIKHKANANCKKEEECSAFWFVHQWRKFLKLARISSIVKPKLRLDHAPITHTHTHM